MYKYKITYNREMLSFYFSLPLLRYFVVAYVFLFCILSFSQKAFSKSLDIYELRDGYKSGHYVSYFIDLDSKKTISEISARDFKQWTQNAKPSISLGYQDSPVWFKIELENSSASEASKLLELDYPLLDKIEVFEIKNASTKKVFEMGDEFLFEKRPIKHRSFVFPINVKAKEKLTLIFKVQTTSSFGFSFLVWGDQTFYEEVNYGNFFYGLLFGIPLIMIFYNLVFYFSFRDKSYVYYIAFFFFMSLTCAFLLGFAFQILWPETTIFNEKGVLFSASLSVVFAYLFALDFLELRKYEPRCAKILDIGNKFVAALIIVSLFIPYKYGIQLLLLQMIFTIPAIIYSSLKIGLSLKKRSALIYFAAWAVFMVSSLGNVFAKLGFISEVFIVKNGLLLGLDLMSVVLSIALADKLNSVNKEKTNAQKAALEKLEEAEQMKRQYYDTLERKVDARTASLRRTVKDLRKTQGKLIESERKAAVTLLSSNLAHELNNPLNYISSSAAILEQTLKDLKAMIMDLFEGAEDEDALDIKEHLSTRFESTDRTLEAMFEGVKKSEHVIEEIRNLTETDGVVQEKIDLESCLQKSIEKSHKVVQVHTKKQIKHQFVNLDMQPVTILSNPYLLTRILDSLLENAFFFAGYSNMIPLVKIDIQTTSADKVTIFISNNGPPIEEKDKKLIFDVEANKQRLYTKQGYGLALVKNLVERIGGEVALSDDGMKSSFVSMKLDLPSVRSKSTLFESNLN